MDLEMPVGLEEIGISRHMTEKEAKIIYLLCQKSGEWIIDQKLHTASGIGGILGKRPDKLMPTFRRMSAMNWLEEFQIPGAGKSIFWRIKPEKSKQTLTEAMKLLGITASPPLIDCEVCGNNYSSLMKGCPNCARLEAEYLLQAKAEDPKRSKSCKVIQTTKITHAPGVGYKKPRDSSTEKFIVEENAPKKKSGLGELPEKKTPKQLTGGATGKTEVAEVNSSEISTDTPKKVSIPRDGSELIPTRSAELNAQSERIREQRTEEARKFGEWCKTQEFNEIERMAVHLLVTDCGNYLVDEQFWPGRVMCLQNERQTEMGKLFKNDAKDDYVRAQLMDAAADIWGRYEQ